MFNAVRSPNHEHAPLVMVASTVIKYMVVGPYSVNLTQVTVVVLHSLKNKKNKNINSQIFMWVILKMIS